MGRYLDLDAGVAGAALAGAGGDLFYELGLMYAAGRAVPLDRVAAHKWFNLAASRGHAEAGERRRELAADMDAGEIAHAQRAARDWLRTQ
ncbi:SEL1-like repeat protein [Ancylobacter terrae]|uniref:SEL1-like repeat protein n=1 Tax=Ancylobacter sp. sgz301288 TaxID=3342077 RepID=UPI003858E2EA